MWWNLFWIILCIWFLFGFIGWGFERAKDYKYNYTYNLGIATSEKLWYIFISLVFGIFMLCVIFEDKKYKNGWRVW